MCNAEGKHQYPDHKFQRVHDHPDQPAFLYDEDESSDDESTSKTQKRRAAYEDFHWDESPLYRISDEELAELERDVSEGEPWEDEDESDEETFPNCQGK